MPNLSKIIIVLFIILDVFLIFFIGVRQLDLVVLNPQGSIAIQQRNLIVTAFLIMCVIVVPVVSCIYFFAYRFRDGANMKHEPNKPRGKLTQAFWWIAPASIVLVLAVITWNATHRLDPYRPIESSVPPIKIQVVALDWKWLFLYPEHGIATVNFVQFPEDTPVNFELTADAPMNSFWIPALAGQVYAMTGMSTKLHVMANEPGDYNGQAAEINGPGFSGMTFTARATTMSEFEDWIENIKSLPESLSSEEYDRLILPSKFHPVTFYSSYEEGLYNGIMMKYMVPSQGEDSMHVERMNH